MDGYFKLCVRVFFGIAVAIDLIFIYAAVFDRDLPRRIAVWFFGFLSGERINLPREENNTGIGQWFIFAFVSAVPFAGWIAFELFFAPRMR